MVFLFWLFAFLLIYPLVIYPLCLIALHKIRKSKKFSMHTSEATLPTVSILLSVFNEEDVITEKIENFLALDYPKEKLELLIVSDQSTDSTESIIEHFASDRIRLIRQEVRGGKTKALNRAAQEARGDIFFFTDADSMLHKDALLHLLAPFADEQVGLVSGRSVYRDEQGNESTGSLYRQYEEWLKEYEGILYGIAGADGAIYAMRREFYQELPEKIINDLAHPIHVVLAGKKALAVPSALVSEPAEDDQNAFARQTRIMAQSWYVFFSHLNFLLQERCWGFLWQFITHKILRWLALPWLAGFMISAFFAGGVLPTTGLVCACLMLLCAALGEMGKTPGRISRLFILQSGAGIYGLIRLWRGNTFVTWNPKGK